MSSPTGLSRHRAYRSVHVGLSSRIALFYSKAYNLLLGSLRFVHSPQATGKPSFVRLITKGGFHLLNVKSMTQTENILEMFVQNGESAYI